MQRSNRVFINYITKYPIQYSCKKWIIPLIKDFLTNFEYVVLLPISKLKNFIY